MLRLIFAISLLFMSAASWGAQYMQHTTQYQPYLKFQHMDGRVSQLQDFEGKLVIIHVWATWCEACLSELESLHAFNETLTDKPVHLLMVCLYDKQDAIKNVLAEKGLTGFDIVIDPELGSVLNTSYLPTTIFIDGTQTEIDRIVGGIDWQSSEIQAKLETIIPKNTPSKK